MAPLLLAFWIGCSAGLPKPTVLAVEPPRGWNGEPTVVTITGSEFYPQVVFDASRKDDADLDLDFTAFLVDAAGTKYALTAVDVQSYEIVQAVVPPDLPDGNYALELHGPTGRFDSLPAAFEVSDTRADRLAIESGPVSFSVDEQAQVAIELLGLDGERLLEDLTVQIEITSDEGMVPVTFFPNALEEEDYGGGGSAVTGRLGLDGYALVAFEVHVARIVTFSVVAIDDVGVSGAEQRLEFTPGNDVVVHFQPFESGFSATAGEPFNITVSLEDTLGNPVEEVHRVTFSAFCGGQSQTVDVAGSTTFAVDVITTATGDECAEQSIVAAEGKVALGQSAGFQVEPGTAERFDLLLLAVPPVHAGDTLGVVVTPIDEWSNRAPWTGDLTWSLDGGPAAPLGCSVLAGGAYWCQFTPTLAGDQQQLAIVGDDGIMGAKAIDVLADDVATEIAVSGPTTAVAGESFPIEYVLTDAWGNQVDGTLFDPATFTVTSEGVPVACMFDSVDLLGTVHVDCTLFSAGLFHLVAAGPVGTPDTLDVDVANGPLAFVAMAAPADIDAGTGFLVEGQGFDAYGNAYLDQSDPVVELADETGTWSAPTATFDALGTFRVTGTLTEAGTTALTASRFGDFLGTTDELQVHPGPAASFDVLALAPWAWVGELLPVGIEARDAWGNVADWDGAVTVASRAGMGAAIADVVDGYGLVELTWGGPALLDAVVATAGALTGESAELHAVLDCAVDPVPVVTFQGLTVARACWDPVAGAEIRGTLKSSISGGAPLAGYALSLGLATDVGLTPVVALDAPGIGRYGLEVLVAQTDGCGAELATTGWVGLADGQPVGPIPLAPDDLVIDVVTGATDVHLDGVLACDARPAAGGTLLIRTDLGDLIGVAPTGAGLAVALDATGSGIVTLDAGSADVGGVATLRAWTAAGTAAGEATVALLGDEREPVVWYQDPEGANAGVAEDVRVTFSEPIGPVSAADVDLVGPSGPVALTVSLADASTLVVTPDQPLDLSANAYTLVVGASVDDLAGNGLDGAFFGSPTDWIGELGAVGGPVGTATCTSLLLAFRPDGDDGAGFEADRAPVAVSSVTQPDRWRLEVTSAGAPLRVERVYAVGSSDVVTWDGRDANGRVVPNGPYTVTITPLDLMGTPGPACAVDVEVANIEVSP